MSDVTVPSPDAASDGLGAARDAFARRDWVRAYELLAAADANDVLTGDDLEAFAIAAYFAARSDEVPDIKERAFQARLADGDRTRAAYLALDIARDQAMFGRTSIASAWTKRGERLLEGQPESYAHGYLALVRSEAAKAAGRLDEALALAQQAVEIGERTADPDLNGWALTALGTLRIATGEPGPGLELLEEASISAVNGELSPFATGVICCAMISACRDLADYQRATEWIEATDRYCRRQSISGFPGACRIHRAEIVAVGGGWQRAEEELRTATNELARFGRTPPVADGHYALAEIRRLQGDYEGAEQALREAHALGRSPQPALALIRLAQGNVKAATAAIASALRDGVEDRLSRPRLLPAEVEIAVAAGDLARARGAAEELAAIVDGYPSPALRAALHEARGRVQLADRDPAGAATELRAAITTWRKVGNPYEVARCRALLARALRELDDEDGADLELGAARDEFERLGAGPDAAAAQRELEAAAARRAAPVQVRRTFMFTDIVSSTRLAEALGDEAWEPLLAWHDRALRGVIERHRGVVVNSTGDGFFAAFALAADAIDGAVAIQRELADQRRATGFALQVRIGLHTAEANERGSDYSGVGVHTAARVAALAEGGEVLATAATLAEAPGVAVADARDVELRGVSGATRVATVRWE